ncbi:MAG: amylo-alpha-1,6-glucosidase [Pseudomonadota bacterium]
MIIHQSPEPGSFLLSFAGDTVCFSLWTDQGDEGQAWLRTDLGQARISRREVTDRVESGEIKHNEAWHDIRMIRQGPGRFSITLPLFEIGHFRAKGYFLPQESIEPLWPQGDNAVINVEPAGSCCANIIYNAFVRQFGITRTGSEVVSETDARIIEILEKKGCSVIPPSGKFRDLIREIPFIFSDLGCRVLHLLPIHPTPTTYARMGRFGSPYAALNFTDVDPALAEFDTTATPLEQFMELVDSVHAHGGYIILDIAINHTGWAAAIHESHPEWLVRGPDGKIEVPGAWGILWEDLTKLDYSKPELWLYMAGVFLLWCRRGVDGFRCDAGYMIPKPAWEYIVSRIRREYPDTIFFLEGLGGKIQTTCDLLDTANLNWAYSELFQNYSRQEIEAYLPGAYDSSAKYGIMVHFAETHDNLRLASRSHTWARMRTALCSLFSVSGGFGFANGVEWFATQKIDVHNAIPLNWGHEPNQVDHIRRLILILRLHPAFGERTRLALVQKGGGNVLALDRHHVPTDKRVLVLANLDCDTAQTVAWDKSDVVMPGNKGWDLVTGGSIAVADHGSRQALELSPGQVLALVGDREDLVMVEAHSTQEKTVPPGVLRQKIKAKTLSLVSAFQGYGDVAAIDLEKESASLVRDPVAYVRQVNPLSRESRVIPWHWPMDIRRQVMVPPGHCLMVLADFPFRAELRKQGGNGETLGFEESLPLETGGYFGLFMPMASLEGKSCRLHLRVFGPGKTQEQTAPLIFLPNPDRRSVRTSYTRQEILADPGLKLLGTNGRGGMMRAAAWWGRLDSRYDALIAANLNPHVPENRWIMLSRCRIWAVYQGYSRELTLNCLETFSFSYDNAGKWVFRVPTSEGNHYFIELVLAMTPGKNRVTLSAFRKSNGDKAHLLGDDKPVILILRPDIENRSFHDTVKAWTGPENAWKNAVAPFENGFVFNPARENRSLFMRILPGRFVPEAQWQYMVYHQMEAERGLDPESDLFSPGYFQVVLMGNQRCLIEGEVLSRSASPDTLPAPPESIQTRDFPLSLSLCDAMLRSLDAFVVSRGEYRSVVAGFPWFLDWGRDSLIFCRALIQADRFDQALAILKLFGRFEDHGTLPNMINGMDAANRETSDAPLWFLACVQELAGRRGASVLTESLGDRTLGDTAVSIARWLIKGTRTGVVMDPASGLLYSPSHFTWMDTNYPAGSPRQGYPVEIQALWHYALTFLGRMNPKGSSHDWTKLADTVRASIQRLYFLDDAGYFSDCLHCQGPVPADDAEPDDALRPNQLFLISLGVIDDIGLKMSCVDTCLELLVPGGIRTLADRPLSRPLTIVHQGRVLGDPTRPYAGVYQGDEDTKRKPAYHNGTAWTWPFPVFCEAWAQVYGQAGDSTALAFLGSSLDDIRRGCAGYVPEILDGDFPHRARGCDAQAWGSSEFVRVWLKLTQRRSK